MTQDELQAGADAVEAMARKHNVAWYFNADNYREIAAGVIAAYLTRHVQEAAEMAVKTAAASPPNPNPPQPPTA